MSTRFYNKTIKYINKKGETVIYNLKCAAISKRCNSVCENDILEFLKQYKDGIDLDTYVKKNNLAIKTFKDLLIKYVLTNKLI